MTTWKTKGFGVCGHKNIYSKKTLLGNWVEDQRKIKEDMLPVSVKTKKFLTESKETFTEPYLTKLDQRNVEFEKLRIEFGRLELSFSELMGSFECKNSREKVFEHVTMKKRVTADKKESSRNTHFLSETMDEMKSDEEKQKCILNRDTKFAVSNKFTKQFVMI
eukprot:snap_masked-scaffold_10-processed-gene-13.29-mRNA-1 protein AED:1.00 eAED:1.00 QI:0/-1/0/0/-1/1/1/0/162